MEKTVSYTTQNTYATLNIKSAKTKNIWIVFHGIGYLSKYFIKYFESLNALENYIIAPQAPSKYYLKNEYKYVGASWLTKENTLMDTDNLLNYLDAVLEMEQITTDLNLILFGFSQGVSISTRWMTRRKIKCKTLILYAGGIPNELEMKDFEYLDWDFTKIKVIYGDQDEYLNTEKLKHEEMKISKLFQGNAEIITFNGGHEMRPEILRTLA